MNDAPADIDLLRRFTREGDQSAFADVVRRHVDLVYATALRHVDGPAVAEEVAQDVFAALARNAWKFGPDKSLPAWLHQTTIFKSREWLRGELRRRRREQTAAELGTTMKTPQEQSALCALVPLLDEALLSLREKDRVALLLRFYESRSLRDVGDSLGVGEDAAQKRVAGALEKIVHFFRRRGFQTATVASTTAALQHTAVSAPAGAVASVTQVATHVAPVAGGLTMGLFTILALTRWQKILLGFMAVSIAIVWQWQQSRTVRADAFAPPTPQTNVGAPANDSLVENNAQSTEPARVAVGQATLAVPDDRGARAKEYSVHLTGFISTADARMALLEIRHHSLERPNVPPLTIHKVLVEGESFDDRSIKDAYVHFELVQVSRDARNVRLSENGVECVYEIENGNALPAEGRNVCLANVRFDEALDVYGTLMGRTVLCYPSTKPVPILATADAKDRAAAIDVLNRILFNKTMAATILHGDKFALLIPTNMLSAVSNALPAPPTATSVSASDTIPAGAFNMLNAPLPQVLDLYGSLSGRHLIPPDRPLPPFGISFRNQTLLSRAEAIYAFNLLFEWQGLKVELVDPDSFKIIQRARP